jgi:hypothetical protein
MEVRDVKEGRFILFWIIGTLLILAGSWIAGHVEWTVGTTKLSYILAIILAFISILMGGLCWIGVAVGASKHV